MTKAPPTVSVIPTADLPATAATMIIDLLNQILARQPQASLALAGGSTPAAIYRILAQRASAVDWRRIVICFGDERCVPPDHGDSNYAMAHDSLLRHLPQPPAAIHRMAGEDRDPAAAARRYAALLPQPLDLLLLGLGEDGHTASLFPGDPILDHHPDAVAAVIGPKPPPQRLTITPPVITGAHRIVVVAQGSAKTAAVAAALAPQGDIHHTPARLARHGTWLIDPAAAG